MTLSNRELVKRFVNGSTSGRANQMDIREGPISYDGTTYVKPGETAIIGYGWAIYASRTDTGRVVVFNGWREWAKGKPGHSGQTTLQHISLIEEKASPTFIYDQRKAQCSSPPRTAKTMRPEYR